MRKISVDALARLPEERRDYRDDAAGFVFLDCLVSEAEPTWTELTPEQREHVRPLSKVDAKQWEAWHAPKE